MGVNIIVSILFLYIGIMKVEGHIKGSDPAIPVDVHNDLSKITDINVNGCECINYDCGCCQYMELDFMSLNGNLCANASYLNYSYGISVTVTFNNFTILNETVSAQDPPPICIGEEIIQQIEAEICLRILDVHINSNKFHACFQILVKLMKFKVFSINLGCIDTKIQNKLTSIKNNTFNLLEVLYKKKTDFESPSVIRV